jgi:hypothetical protein
MIIGCVGYNAYIRDGLKFRAIEKVNSFNSEAFNWPNNKYSSDQCKGNIYPLRADYCMISEDRPVKIALIGDSHANAIFPFVDEYFLKKGEGVIQLGKCIPLLGVEIDKSNSCSNSMSDILSWIANNEEITKVFISGRFAAAFTGIDFGRHTPENWFSMRLHSDPSMNDRSLIFKIGLSRAIDKLQIANKDITIILDVPELNFDPRSCITSRLKSVCAIDRKLVIERQIGYRKVIDELTKENKKITILARSYC